MKQQILNWLQSRHTTIHSTATVDVLLALTDPDDDKAGEVLGALFAERARRLAEKVTKVSE